VGVLRKPTDGEGGFAERGAHARRRVDGLWEPRRDRRFPARNRACSPTKRALGGRGIVWPVSSPAFREIAMEAPHQQSACAPLHVTTGSCLVKEHPLELHCSYIAGT